MSLPSHDANAIPHVVTPRIKPQTTKTYLAEFTAFNDKRLGRKVEEHAGLIGMQDGLLPAVDDSSTGREQR